MAEAGAELATADAGFSKEYVDKLKAELEAQKEEQSRLRAFKNTHDQKQRKIVEGLQPEVQGFLSDLSAANPDRASDMAPMLEWSRNCAASESLETTLPLAVCFSAASAGLKRSREEASVLSGKAETLSSTLQELESVKEDASKKAARISELEGLCNEREEAATKLRDELARHGVIADKLNFSKLTSREVNADASSSAAASSSASASSSLVAETSCASKGSKAVEDELMSFVRGASSAAAGRFTQSSTGHAMRGSTTGSMDAEIASAIRSAY